MTEKKDSSGKPRRSRRAQAKQKKHKGLKRALLALVLGLILLPLGGFIAAYIMVDVPEPEELTVKQVSQIYASDSTTELARIVPPEGNRRIVKIEQIPTGVRNAVLAAEDREFYTNQGFSFSGFGRAVIGQLTGNPTLGGGSTITQQYVKNALVGNERSYERKAKELVYSVKMANEWSKDDVLAAYLNTVYFGRNAYGVEAAAHAYFGKSVSDLNPAEGAVLAASIQRPSQLDPWQNPEGAHARWNYVLDGMVTTGAITQAERDSMEYPETTDPALNRTNTEADGPNSLVKNHVIAELEEKGITEADVSTRGLQITTTIDPQAQNAVIEAMRSQLEGQNDNLRTAAVSVDPATGGVRAYYGGDDAGGWDYGTSALQTGSTFKVFGLAAALQQGIPTSTIYESSPVTIGDLTITNVEGEDCGYCSIKQALKESLNTSFIRLQEDLKHGPKDTADMAHALGVARSLPGIPHTLTEGDGDAPYAGVILGQYLSRPIDMAVAMATLANEGVWHDPHFVQRVETANGEVLYEYDGGPGERRVDANVANNVLDAMLPIAGWSNGNNLAGGRPSAAKTGTAQLGDTGQNKDAWMIGATPQLSTAVWVGSDDNSPITTPWGGLMYGAGLPASIWKATMDGALEGKEIRNFTPPKPINYGIGHKAGTPYVPPVITQPTDVATPTKEPGEGEEGQDPENPQHPGEPGQPGAPAPGQPAPGHPAPAPGQPGRPVPPPAPQPAPPPPPQQGVEILPGIFLPAPGARQG